MAKDRNHEIVRALVTHPKAISWKFENEICMVMGLQV
jgi:hypothetical protein